MVFEHTDIKMFPELIIIDKATLTICKNVQISDYILSRTFLMKNHWVKGSEHFPGSSQYSKQIAFKETDINSYAPYWCKDGAFLDPVATSIKMLT